MPCTGRSTSGASLAGFAPGKADVGRSLGDVHMNAMAKKDARDVGETGDDKRLDRLLDYTKFHIGIYLSIGGGLVALLGSSANIQFLDRLIGSPPALALALIFIVVAGIAGGIIASCTTQYRTFDDFWSKCQGPHTSKLFTGKTWVLIEHGSFWISLFLVAYSILSAPAVWTWLGS
jgi:hypothetical protein